MVGESDAPPRGVWGVVGDEGISPEETMSCGARAAASAGGRFAAREEIIFLRAL